jgi:hypothetical protein
MLTAIPQKASAWGDDGHKTVALIAEHYLTSAAKRQVDALLAADTDPLTKHDLASEATWGTSTATATTGETITRRRSAGTLSTWKSRIPI